MSREHCLIAECEANHLSLTIQGHREYKRLKKSVKYSCAVVGISSNPDSRQKEEEAILKLLQFEEEYNLI